MNYFSILAELALLLLFSTLLGRRVTSCLPKATQDSIGFYLAPLSGLAVFLWVAMCYGSFFAFHFNHSLFVVLALALFAMLFEKNPKELLFDWGQVFLFSILCSLPVLASLFHYQGYNPFTDTFTYLAQAQWLQMHPFLEKAISSGYYPYLTQIELYQRTGSRMGGTFLLGFIQSLFHLRWSYDAYLTAMSLGFVTGCLAIGGIINQVVPLKRMLILALALLPAFTLNGFVFGAEWGFYPQTLGLAFASGVVALFPSVFAEVASRKRIVFAKLLRYVLPVSMCTAGLLLAYNEPFPIFALALFIFIGIAAWTNRKSLMLIGMLLLAYSIEVVLLVNKEVLRIAQNLWQTIGVSQNAGIGWPVLWEPTQFLAHAFGMKSAFTNGIFRLDYLISVWLFPICFIALMVVLVRFFRRQPKLNLTLVLLCCVDLVLLLCWVKFRYFTPNVTPLEMGNSFLQFKIAKYATPFSLALLGIGLAIVWQDYRKYRSFFIRLYGVALILGLSFQCLPVTKALHQNFSNEMRQSHHPFQGLLALREAVSSIPQDQVIYLALGPHEKLRQMVAYVLYDRKVASDYRNDGYILGHLPIDERVMDIQQANTILSLGSRYHSCDKQAKFVGPFLIQRKPFHKLILQQQTGGHGAEINAQGDEWYWVDQGVDFEYLPFGDVHKTRFIFKLQTLDKPRNIRVELRNTSGKPLWHKRFSHRTDFIVETPWINIEHLKRVVLHVEADGAAQHLSNRDPRVARFKIENIEVCV